MQSESRKGVFGASPLHLCMMGLVLLNLVFVTLTESASIEWLAPLFALTLASPLLARFKESIVYRSLWNVGVVAFFGLLVRHAMSADLAFVLQDGLVLAVLCQVHLLNNLHADQRPDLLFLNSYLIAVITGYLTVDLGFSGAFLVYAPFYICGLQFLSVFRPGKTASHQEARVIARDGLKRSGILLALTLPIFLFWPRDFEREAMYAKYFDLEAQSGSYEVDFSRQLELERKGRAKTTGRTVMVAKLRQGSPAVVSDLWRGATLDRNDWSGSWSASEGAAVSFDVPTRSATWQPKRRSLELHRGTPGRVVLDVVRNGTGTRAVFFPASATDIRLDGIHSAGKLVTRGDDTAEYSNPGELRYRLTLGESTFDEPLELSPQDRARLLQLERSPHVKTAADLAVRLRERLPEDATTEDLAVRFTEYLRGRYDYVAPGQDGAAETLHQFLATNAGGHCEYFASTLAIMLRAIDIPARVVTGYRVHSWDETGTKLEVSSLDAHAWVEAHVDGSGWIPLDATPAAERSATGPSLMARAQAKMSAFWSRVTDFDGESRAAAVAWLRAVPRRLAAGVSAHPLRAAGAVFILLALVVAVRDRRRGRIPVEVRDLSRAIGRAGAELAPDETPRELLARIDGTELSPEVLAALEVAVVSHERARYGAAA